MVPWLLGIMKSVIFESSFGFFKTGGTAKVRECLMELQKT